MFGFLKTLFATGADASSGKPPRTTVDKRTQAAIDKRARQIAPQAAAKAAPVPAQGSQPKDVRAAALATIRTHSAQVMTPQRQALIQNALNVQRAKRQILENLDDETRAKLVAMTITMLMREGDTPPAPPAAARRTPPPAKGGK